MKNYLLRISCTLNKVLTQFGSINSRVLMLYLMENPINEVEAQHNVSKQTSSAIALKLFVNVQYYLLNKHFMHILLPGYWLVFIFTRADPPSCKFKS